MNYSSGDIFTVFKLTVPDTPENIYPLKYFIEKLEVDMQTPVTDNKLVFVVLDNNIYKYLISDQLSVSMAPEVLDLD